MPYRNAIECSNCGRKRRFLKPDFSEIERAINEGWGSYGGVLYCPECSATWAERNGSKPMGSKRNTFKNILNWLLRG